jgi:flagellar hook-basal body complex protein FliE
MAVGPISGAAASLPIGPAANTKPTPGFGDMLSGAIDTVSAAENKADNLLEKLARGEDVELHQVTIATTEAALSVQLMVAVRDQAVDAYTQIMNMQF